VNFPKYPYQPFDEPIPRPGPERGALCFSVDARWRPYLIGLLKTLLVERTWETDEIRASGEASELLAEIMAAEFCPGPEKPGLEGDDMGCCLRYSDNGVLQMFSCGEWVDVPGTAQNALANGSQPAQGAPQPAAGECQSFIGKVLFFGRWLLPVPVSSGDVIKVANAFGATTDYILDFPGWKCGDGTEFVAGGCVNGTAGFNAGDPAPSIHHGNLIGFDGTNYYDFGEAANSQIVTVPILAGITDANFAMMINSEGPAGAGDISFDITICKAAATPFSITYTEGSGPASAMPGTTFVAESAAVFGTNNLDISFSPCCKLTIVGVSGFTCPSNPGGTIWNQIDCASVSHPNNVPGNCNLLDYSNLETSRVGLDSDTAFALTLRCDPL